jgi:pSer/pThr/pTyr-binding forkhead associated (FHA) protein
MLSEQATALRADPAITLVRPLAEQIGLALSDTLNLTAKGYGPVHVTVPKGQEVVLGRSHPTNHIQPNIDLTPYNATQQGVSRIHARIRHDEQGWWIEDLKSSNGTWVNGRRIAPFAPYPLEGVALLSLSKFEIYVILPGSTLPA